MGKKSKKASPGQIASNKKAFHDYHIEERFEAGIVLEGWEVKSIRDARVQLKESYIVIRGIEAWIIGMHISPLSTASTHITTEFIPWCVESEVIDPAENELKARLCFTGHGFTKSFTTHNRLEKNKSIELHLLEGPFKQLEGGWYFEDVGDNSSRISVNMSFEFSNRMIGMLIGPVFQTAADTLIEAFKQRAEDVYGKEKLES